MKVSIFAAESLLALVALMPTSTKANFDIYVGQDFAWDTPYNTWQIFEAEPSCNDAWNSPLYFDRDDVSHWDGVRCDGKGCKNNYPSQVKTLEMAFTHSHPVYHWTIYHDRNWNMYGLDGKIYGRCIPFPSDDYLCAGAFGSRQGVRMFRCLTKFTAPQINAAFSNKKMSALETEFEMSNRTSPEA